MGHGKFQSLLATVEGHWAALEFDLLGKVDLPGVWTGSTSWRTVALCVEQLRADPSSALSRSIRDSIRPPSDEPMPEGDALVRAILRTEWSPERWGLHEVASLIQQLLWQNSATSADSPRPTPLPAPGDEINLPLTDFSGRVIPDYDSPDMQDYLAWMYAQPTR